MITVYRLDGVDPEPIAEYDDGEWVDGADRMEPIFGPDAPPQDELLESLDGPRLFASLPDDENQKGLDEADHRDPAEVLDDPDEPTTNSLALKEDRTYVGSVHEAPRDAIVHSDDDGLYYVEEKAAAADAWVPYTGPQGGNGWRNLETGDVTYSDEPPGGIPSPDDLPKEVIDAIADEEGVEPEDVYDALVDLQDGENEAGSDLGPEAADVIGAERGDGTFNVMQAFDEAGIDDAVGDPADIQPDEAAEIWERTGRDGQPPDWVMDGVTKDDLAFAVSEEDASFGDNLFGGHGADLDPMMDPANAESIEPLVDEWDATPGRSADSMYVAEGVPDGEGGTHRLYITNTNYERSIDAEGEYDGGDRCVAGEAGFREAGFDPPEYVNVDGEFWASAEVDGEPASDTKWDEIADTPEEAADKLTELFAPALALGAWDMHGENVFVSDGELVPVDLDLAGGELHGGVERYGNNNPYSASQHDAWRRFSGLWSDMMLDRTDADWDAAVDETKRKVEEMADSGQFRDMVKASADAAESPDIEAALEENMFKAEKGAFFNEDVIESAKEEL